MNEQNTYLCLTFNGASKSIVTEETIEAVLEKLEQAAEDNKSVKFYCVDKKEYLFVSPNNVPATSVEDIRSKQNK